MSRDPSGCILACSQTASNHPAKGAAPVGTLLAAKAVGFAEAWAPESGSAVSGVWAAAVEVAVVEAVVVEAADVVAVVKVVAAVW